MAVTSETVVMKAGLGGRPTIRPLVERLRLALDAGEDADTFPFDDAKTLHDLVLPADDRSGAQWKGPGILGYERCSRVCHFPLCCLPCPTDRCGTSARWTGRRSAITHSRRFFRLPLYRLAARWGQCRAVSRYRRPRQIRTKHLLGKRGRPWQPARTCDRCPRCLRAARRSGLRGRSAAPASALSSLVTTRPKPGFGCWLAPNTVWSCSHARSHGRGTGRLREPALVLRARIGNGRCDRRRHSACR